jgi:hypothetical protein
LVIYVERSERRPHRSEAKGDKQYYKRSGESSFVMEHFDIEDMFRRHTVAALDVDWHLQDLGGSSHGDGTASVKMGVVISLTNNSNVTAKFPYLHVVAGSFQSEIWGGSGLPLRITATGWLLFEGGADHVINPGVTREIAKLVFQIPRREHGVAPDLNAVNFPLKVEYGCGCEHSAIRHGVIEVKFAEVVKLYFGQG